MPKLFFILFVAIAISIWCMNIWGGWAEKTYEKSKGNNATWYWLRVFKVEQTEKNCIKLIKITSLIGTIVILTIK